MYNRKNKGIKKLQYRFCSSLRGHKGERNKDIVVKHGRSLLTRVGVSRPIALQHLHIMDLGKFMCFVARDISYTKACLKHFSKFVRVLEEKERNDRKK